MQGYHKHPDAHVDESTVDRHHPCREIDATDEINNYRDASRKFAFIMNRYAEFVVGSENPRLAAWQGAIAIGLACCEGIKYEEIAKMCGVGITSTTKGRAAVSKGVKFFSEANSLRPSFYMKESTKAFKDARNKSVNDNTTSNIAA